MWPILIAHHPPEEGHRCARLGPLPVCRRCLATWPLAAATLAAGLAGHLPPAGPLELALLWGPAMGEYVATQLGGLPYRAGRTWAFGALLGLGLGRTLHRYLLDPADALAWTALLTAGLPMLAAGVAASVRAHHRSVKKPDEE